jgi:hypothetical protein
MGALHFQKFHSLHCLLIQSRKYRKDTYQVGVLRELPQAIMVRHLFNAAKNSAFQSFICLLSGEF